jgi:hypothetical protein
MADKISYEDKILNKLSKLLPAKTWRFQDANEVKRVVNSHADELESLSFNVDGGGANSIYLQNQIIDGGDSNS